jgi:hypothetical protein
MIAIDVEDFDCFVQSIDFLDLTGFWNLLGLVRIRDGSGALFLNCPAFKGRAIQKKAGTYSPTTLER